jgi:Carboxypeptidase regulatory-like domain/TonB dependent receptor
MNKKIRTALVLALFACASLVLIAPARAQSVYGSIFGTVTDKSGAAIPGATVSVTSVSKNTTVTVTSNGSGDYNVAHLIPDTYNLKVEANGFKGFAAQGIQVQADTSPRIDPTLDVGGASETVQVNADQEPVLKTDRADVATVFDQQQISSLPVGDQNFTNLQLLLPGAQKLGWSHAADENPQGSQQIQVDGQAFGGTAFELDGTDNQDPILGIIVINPAMDAVTETKITTQNFDAELGKAVSAVVTAQTRSGTNSFHGSVYDFRTGNANQARDPYTQQPGPNAIPPGLKNRFGGSIGGRVIRDKFFMFGNYEAQRQKVGTSASDTVPTQHLISTCLSPGGCDFSEYADKLVGKGGQLIYEQVNDPDNPGQTKSVPFPNNIIPSKLLSVPALTLLKLLQPYAPNTGGDSVTNNFSEGGTGLFNSDQWTIRGDYTINEKMHAFGRFSRFTDVLSGRVMFGDAGGPGFGIGNYGGNSKGANESLASGMDIALNASLITDWRFGYYRYNVVDSKYSTAELANAWGMNGINTGNPFTAGAPGFQVAFPFSGTQSTFGAGLNINRCNCPLTEDENQYQFVNNWTKVFGNHSVKVGVDLRYAHNLRVPSDTDRAGLFTFGTSPTSNNGTNGLGFATFVLGESTSFGRYVSTSTSAKEFQPRNFFYGQDTWRVTRNLTLNLGLRYELYLPESVNAAGNGSLMKLSDGYMHVAGIGGIPSNMGWSVSYGKLFDPRIGLAWQMDEKTVIRAGYGRSFDTGVFGSIFGHVVTQNLPVLANQSINASGTTGSLPFSLSTGPPAFTFPVVPSNGLLPAQAYQVSPKARPDPLHFPTIDAWNLAFQRAITPTLSLTMAYVGNKGTHTLGDTDQNNTDPNESALFLPGGYSRNGQTLHWDPKAPGISATSNGIAADGGVSNSKLLKRFYSGSLAACKDPNYIALSNPDPNNPGLQQVDNDPHLLPGQCGWGNGISYYGDDQNTEFDALQVTLAKTMTKGLAATVNYQWASAFGDANGYWTWDHTVTHYRDSNVRRQQLVAYGSYDLPFGHGKQYLAGVNRATDLLIGGYQISTVVNWSSGLPFGLGYSNFNPWLGDPNKKPADWPDEDCNHNVGGTAAPCRPNAHGTLRTNLTKFDPASHTRTFWNPQPQKPTGGTFSFAGLDNIGNAGNNNYTGPSFFNTDMSLSKTFTIHESVAAIFRFDTFNTFNHINAGNPNTTNIFSSGPISGQAAAATARYLTFSGRVQF